MSLLDSLARPRTLGVLLAVSFGANLFLLGLLGGRMGARMLHPPMFERSFEHGMLQVPEPHRRAMHERLRGLLPQMREHHEAMRTLHAELGAALGKDAPDRAAIEALLVRIRAETGKAQQALHARFLDELLKLSPAEREAALGMMMHPGGPGAGFGRHGGRMGGMPMPPPGGPAGGMPMPPPGAPPQSPGEAPAP